MPKRKNALPPYLAAVRDYNKYAKRESRARLKERARLEGQAGRSLRQRRPMRRPEEPYWEGNLEYFDGEVFWEPQHRDAEHPLGECDRRPDCLCPQVYLARMGPEINEALYGGAAGGGKSDLLLAEAARYAHHPQYRGYIFRRTYPELARLIDRAKDLYYEIEPKMNEQGLGWVKNESEFRWPSGAVIRMRHMDEHDDWRKYQGHEIHFAGWDELTQFHKLQYDKIKAWTRSSIPEIRAYIRATSNPKGVGHGWVKARFVDLGEYRPETERLEDPTTKKVYETTRIFVPATVYDNKFYRNDPVYMAALLAMPEEDKQAFFYGNWEQHEGTFFTDWQPNRHLVDAFEIPKQWRRFGMLDHGYATPFCYLQAAVSPDRVIYLYKEIYAQRIKDSDQAKRIAQDLENDPPEYIVAGIDVWAKRGGGPHGESTADTYRTIWDGKAPDVWVGKFPTSLRKGDNDRIRGWRRVREYLRGDEPQLRIFRGACPNLVRTLPLAQHDENDPEDVSQDGPGTLGSGDGEDHAIEALRLGLMSRPAPSAPPKAPNPVELTGAWFLEQIKKRKLAARYIQPV